jgi:hypothetical protein
MPSARSVEALLSAYPTDVQQLAQYTRRWVKRLLPHASENADMSARLIGYSYGPGYKGAVCTLILSKTGIKLGLVGGAALSDPHGLLAGDGKIHRHVPLRKVEDLQQAGLQQLVLASSAACRARLGLER